MATDTTNFTPDMNANSADNEPNFDAVQLAQATPAGAPVQIVIPSGANVVRVPVTAGETVELPFGADAHLLGKLGDNGNLAIKVGDITVILEGYTAAEGQQPVVIETADGKPVDVATVLAATDPNLDIQTAAGGAEGAQGADNTGAIFEAFGPGNGIGGFGAVGALDGTALQYKLIDADAKFFLEGTGEPADTHPTPTNTVGEVDENGKKHLHENPFDDCYGGIVTNPSQPGDDEWAAKITLKIVDFGPDGPAAVDALVGDDAGGTKPPCLDTNGNQVYSHGEPIVLVWNAAEQRLEGWVEDSTECDHCPRLVFTATVETDSGGVATGDICFKLLGPLDHPFNYDPDAVQPVLTLADAETGDGTSGDGDGCCDPHAKWHEFEDNIILDLHFAAKDSDDVTSTDIPVKVNVDDDSPAFLDCNFDPCQGYTIVADETHGVQCGTDDVDVTFCFLQAVAGEQVEPGESTIFDKFVCFFGYDAVQNLDICDITAAQKHLKFGYGADGPLVHEICCDGSEGNPEVPSLQSLGKEEGYNQNGDCIINCGALLTNSCGDVYFCEDTGLTITVGDCENTHTLCIKMEGFGNTIFGYAEDYGQQSIQGGEGGGSCKIPVFIITIDPDTKELTYVQLHQINHDNQWDPNEANDGGEGSCHVLEQINIGLAVTDYDHDSIWTPVHVTVLDDGPKLECVTYNCVEDIYSNHFSSDDLKGGELIDGLGGTPSAIITGGSLQLTDESFSHNDSQWLKIDGGSEFHGSFHASFDVILNDTGEGGSADGFSFQVGNDVNTDDNDGVGAEESNTSGFALTFDTYDNDGDSSNPADVGDEVAVWFNGVKLDSRSDLGDLNGLSPLNVTVDVQGSHYSVLINGTEYFHGNLGGTIPSDADFYIGARTGGEADIQGVDNICITAPCTEAHVDEDFLYKGNHDTDGGPGAHGDDEGSTCATGQVHVDFGRDQPGSFCLDKLTITDDKGCVVFDGCQVDNLYTSKGEHVDIEFCGDKVIGTACGQPVFTLTIDCNGCFKFELCQALEHPFHDADLQNNGPDKNFEDNLHFDFGVKAIDCDGDAVCTEIKVDVDDDAPAICGVCYISQDTSPQDTQETLVSRGGTIVSCEFGSVDEDFLPKGNHDYDTNPDNLNNPFGDGNNGDGPGGLCVTGHINGKVGADQPGTYSFNIPGLCLGGEPVATCLKTSNGDHPISLVLCQEGCNWVVKGVYDCNGEAEGGEAEAFRVTLDSKCGDFKFELEAALEHPDTNGNPSDNNWDNGFSRYEDDLCLNFGVKLTDSDGDSACTTLTFKVDDDAPVICDVVYHNQETGQPALALVDGGEGTPVKLNYGTVDEDFLPKGNHDKDTNPDNLNNPYGDGNNGDGPGGTCVTGCIIAKVGADQPGSFLFDIPGLCESGDTIPTCLKTSNGDHPISLVLCQEGCNWVVKGIFDCNGDAEGGEAEAFRVTLDSKTGEFKFELEAALQHPDSNGNPADNNWDDGVSRYEDDICLDFGVKVVDSDGDAAKTCLTFKVDDDAPVICGVTYHNQNTGEPVEVRVDGGEGHTSSKYGEVDEDFLPKGNHDHDTNPDNLNNPFGDGNNGDGPGGLCVTGCIEAKIGADQPGSFLFDIPGLCKSGDTVETCLKTSNGDHPISLVLCQEGCNWIVKGIFDCNGDAEGGQSEAFRVTLDSITGQFKFELEAALEHPDSNGNPADNKWDDGFARYEDDICLDFHVKVVDSDGDAAKTCLTFKVDDDAPVICDVTYHNQETGQPEVQILTDGGEGTPAPKAQYGQVDEDWLPNGNHDHDTDPDNLNNPFGDGNNGDGPGGLCVTGCIEAKIGADQPGSYLFNIPGLCESGDSVESCYKTSEGYPITLTLCQEGCNWVIKGTYVDGVVQGDPTEEAFKITLDSKTGQFKFELETALQHPDSNGDHSDDKQDDGTNRYEDDLFVKFDVKVVDSDGDAAKTCLVFKVDDDAPVQCNQIDWTVDEDAHHTPDSWEPGHPLAGGIEGGPGDSATDWIGFTANLGVKFGADGPAEVNPYSFAKLDGTNVQGFNDSGTPIGDLTSDGKAIVYHWDAATSTLTASTEDRPIFTAHIDQATGDLTYQLVGPIDHPDTNNDNSDDATDDGKSSWEDNIRIDLHFTATDADGDAICGLATVRVNDDSPAFDGSSCYTSNLIGNGSFEDAGGTLHIDHGSWQTYSDLPGGWTAANPDTTGYIEVQHTGTIGLTPFDGDSYIELDSADSAGGNGADNSHVFQDINLQPDDVSGDFLLTFAYSPRSQDPADTSDVQVWFGGNLITTITGGTVGQWTEYSLLVHGNGSATQRLEFVGAGTPESIGGFIDNVGLKCVVSVDEDASLNPGNRAPGIEGGPGDDGVVGHCATGNLGVQFGADGPGGFSFDPTCQPTDLKSHGETVQYESDGKGGLIAFIATGHETIFTLTVQDNGDFKFDLVRPLDHPDTNNDHSDDATDDGKSSYEDNLLFNLHFVATDNDGDAVKGSITINVDDDSPTVDGGEAPCIAPCNEREEAAHEHFNVDATMISVTDHNGDPATLIINGNGFGVGSDSDGGDGGRFDEINYVGDGATGFPTDFEHLVADFGGKVASGADVDLTVFFGSEGAVGNEQGAYRLFLDGVPGEWHIFSANSGTGLFNFHINPDAGTDGFDKIEFVAIPGSSDPDGNDAGDSSDYSIGNIAVDLKACAQSEGDFTFGYGADGPGSVKLGQPDPQDPAFALTSHGEPIVYTVAPDGLSMTGTINGDQPVFELTINPDTGKFHFYLYEPIDGAGEGDIHIPFQVQVTDYDGDAVSATIQVCVEQERPTPPIFEDETTILDEDGLPGGNNPDTVNPQGAGDLVGGHQELGLPVVANEAISRDSLNINWQGDVGTVKFSLTDAQLADIHPLSGATLTTANVSGNDSGDIKVWDGTPGASNLILEVKLIDAATSVFEAQLYQPIKHTVNGTEDTKDLPVTVTAENSGGPVSHDLQVRINDDLPIASNDYKTLSATGVDTNLMIVLDISGSMGDNSGLTALDRLDAARAAINELFEQYDSAGNVSVKIVTFSTGAGEEAGGWHTIAEAKAFLDGLNPGGTTNYGAAIAQAETAFAESGKIAGGQNVSYFVSDGKPNPAATGLDAGEQTAWENFVSTNHIVSQAIGIGTGVSATELNPIAYDGVHNTQIPSIIVTDLNNLTAALVGTISGGITGDLDGSPSKFGADGGFVQTVNVNGSIFTYNALANSVGGLGAGSSYDATTHILSVHTSALDGALALNLLDGSYNYIRSSDANKSGSEIINYTLSDNDGDTANGSLIVTVPSVDLAPIGRDDHIITNINNGGGNETITSSDAALLWNDSDANHDALSITGIGGITDLVSVTHTAPNVIVIDSSGGGSFDYTLTANTKTDTAHVTVDRGQAGEGTLDGDGLDNILIDRDGSNDTLKGYEGRDALIGGTGDNNFIGGKGDDLIDLSKGGNDTVTIESKLDGNDLLVGFSTGNAASNDQVNLDGLFDSYGAMSGTRADHVTTTQVGGDVSVNVDTDNNTGNGFEMHITIQGVTLANINVGVSGGDNEVILGS